MPHSNCHISYLTLPIGKFLIILECGRHKLYIAHGITLVTSTLQGWEVFSMPGTLTYNRITLALSPMAAQVPDVTPGSPLGPWCCGHSSWRGAWQNRCFTLVNAHKTKDCTPDNTIPYGYSHAHVTYQDVNAQPDFDQIYYASYITVEPPITSNPNTALIGSPLYTHSYPN